MKNYRITVNGVTYDVEVEEISADQMGEQAAKTAAAPSAPAPKAPAKKAPAKAAGAAGSITINAPMPGKIVDIKVKAGDQVTKGQVAVILEAMKMENEIVAPQDGTVASINVNEGASVEAGTVLATMN